MALLDKAVFPRDKICGDAIGGRAKRVLHSINPGLAKRLDLFPQQLVAKGWELYAPSGRSVQAFFKNSGYISARVDFDHFLLKELKSKEHIDIYENCKVTAVISAAQYVTVITEKGEFRSSILLACDGANSVTARKILKRSVDPDNHSGAVRAYYKGIKSSDTPGMLEIHLIKDRLPGYFWIFPLTGGMFNVGFGMLSRDISSRKIDLKKSFASIISETPQLKSRFEKATPVSEIHGLGLPLGGKEIPISADRILFCGDAASLIDPLNGEGIGNAMLSGKIAAEWTLKAFEKNDFSHDFLSGYDAEVYRLLGKELRFKKRMQSLFNRIWLIELLVRLGRFSPMLREKIASKL